MKLQMQIMYCTIYERNINNIQVHMQTNVNAKNYKL